MNNPYIRLFTGKAFHYLRPKLSEIDIKDIIHSLSIVPRYNGHTPKPYYVLQHVCICHDHGPEKYRKELLGHDYTEYVMQDVPAPLKQLIPQYKAIEVRLEKLLAKKFDMEYPYPPEVKEIDLTVLATEIRDLMKTNDYKLLPYKPLPITIVPWSSEKCKKEFQKRFDALYR